MLIEVEIGHHGLAGPGADQAADAIAHRFAEREPAGGVPASDQALGPFLARRLLELGKHRLGRGPQGIAVEIDDAGRQVEQFALGAQRIGMVEGVRPTRADRRQRYFIHGGSGRFFSRRNCGLNSLD